MNNKSNDVFRKPYIISEVGVNHEGDMDKAEQMIREVAQAGGDAVKFQAYKAETLASKYSPAYWDTSKEKTKSQYELFKRHDSFWRSEFEELAEYSHKNKVDFLATPFDIESVDFLEPLVPSYKIASADITNKPFLEYVARKEKPVLLSTGASTISEIWRAVEWMKNNGNEDITLLHCVLNYPTDYKDANLGMIKHMAEIFPDYVIGYSDHTLPEYTNDALISSWYLGAMVIEKHYTWNKTLPGNDHYHAMDYQDLKSLVEKIELNQEILGHYQKKYLESEDDSRKYARRSLVAARFIGKGITITPDDVTWKRPGTGIPPWMIDEVIGSEASEDIQEDEILKMGKIKFEE